MKSRESVISRKLSQNATFSVVQEGHHDVHIILINFQSLKKRTKSRHPRLVFGQNVDNNVKFMHIKGIGDIPTVRPFKK